MGVRFRGVSVTDVAMPVRAVCKPHSPDLKRGALATDTRGCSLWRSLLERPPPAPASRVRDPLGELVRTRVGGLHRHTLLQIIVLKKVIQAMPQKNHFWFHKEPFSQRFFKEPSLP